MKFEISYITLPRVIANKFPCPRSADLLLIAAAAILLRVAVFAAAVAMKPLTIAQYTAKGDTTSYIAVASAMSGERSYRSLGEYDRRVFPGYPALIAIVHLARIPFPIAALVVTWLCAGIAPAAAARAFNDVRIGWAMTCLIPHYLINSSLGMSEAPLLAGLCVGLALSQRDRTISAGVVFGLSALIRPMACFALLGVLVRDLFSPKPALRYSEEPNSGQPLRGSSLTTRDTLFPRKDFSPRRRRDAEWKTNKEKSVVGGNSKSSAISLFSASRRLRGSTSLRVQQRCADKYLGTGMARAMSLATAAAVTFTAGFAVMQCWTGNALQGIHIYANHPGAYAGHMIVWPFESLVTETRHASVWRSIYIWLHVIVVLLAVALSAARALFTRRPDPRDSASFPWLFCNTAMVLCLGPPWGFAHFPRFSIPAEPAVFWTLRAALPSNRWIWFGIASVTFVFAVIGVIGSP